MLSHSLYDQHKRSQFQIGLFIGPSKDLKWWYSMIFASYCSMYIFSITAHYTIGTIRLAAVGNGPICVFFFHGLIEHFLYLMLLELPNRKSRVTYEFGKKLYYSVNTAVVKAK